MKTILKPLLLAFSCAVVTAAIAADKWDIAKLDLSKLPPAVTGKSGLTYDKDIHPMLEASCLRCHGEDRPKGRLRLDTLADALKGGKDGKVIISGDSKNSLLVAAAAQISDEVAMPPKKRPGGPGGPGSRGPGGKNFDGPNAGGPGVGDGRNRPPGANPEGGPPAGGSRGGGFGPPPKALTAEQVSLLRAWIDQGAK